MSAMLVLPKWKIEHHGIEYEAEYATVERFHIGREDHGLFTVDLGFVAGGWGQGLPARGLDEYDKETDSRHGTAFGMDFIIECVNRIGSPEDAKGSRVVVLRREPYGNIDGFAALHDEGSIGEPFIPAELAAKHYPDSR